MSIFTITGGTPLFGSVRVGGAKNASYKLMIAALLADSPSRILNFSKISDVDLVADMITSLGGVASEIGDRAYLIDPRSLANWSLNTSYGKASRASTMFIPALVARFGRAIVPFPGGDNIGKRPLDRHFAGLEALGMKITTTAEAIEVSAEPGSLHGAHYRFEKNTHTGTETLILAAVKAQGHTTLENAAEETEVDDLINYLNFMGAKIRRTAPRTIEIDGVAHLDGTIYKLMPDHNQVVSFACAALATKGDVVVENTRAEDIEAFLEKLDEIGAGYELGSYGARFFYRGPLTATNVTTAVHPGFKTDWQPLWVTLMTQASGTSTLHETVQQSRFQYVGALTQMGANIELFNPSVDNPSETYNFNLEDVHSTDLHAARITGPSQLRGGEFEVTDLRHGATLLIAGLIAQGKTVLQDPINHIDRGYEELDKQLKAMGAQIERTSQA